MNTYNYIFTGGSTRGLCYTGVLRALEEFGIEPAIYCGSSIGSLFCVFHAIGYSSLEIEKEINDLNIRGLFCDFNINIINDLAISKGKIYLDWLREKIERKYYGETYVKNKMSNICFKDLKKDVMIFATDLEKSSYYVFSKETTPQVEIALALKASSSMPGLLPYVEFDGRYLIDGDIMRARPIWKEVNNLLDNGYKTLEFRITGGRKNKISKNPIKLINSIVNIAAYNIDNEAEIDYKYSEKVKVIKIDVPETDFTEFNFSLQQKSEIYKIGYDKTIEELKDL